LTKYFQVLKLTGMRHGKSAKPLLPEQRRRTILDLLERQGQISVQDLVDQFSISAVTVRADLDALSSTGALVRSHGGAVRRLEPTHDYPLDLKQSVHRSEKVQTGEVIILDSGTTTTETARQLKIRAIHGVTVISNAMNVVSELVDAPEISVISIGGVLRPVSHSFVGPQAEAMLKDLHADRLFLGVDGFDLEYGPSTPDVLEAQLNGLMMTVARETTVVADFSKLGRRSVSRIGSIDGVHRLITDSKAPEDFVKALRARGIEVIQV
jgi:DeoR family transcriptional regulator of aga operon